MKQRKNIYCWQHLFSIQFKNADIFQLEVVFAKTFAKNLEPHFAKSLFGSTLATDTLCNNFNKYKNPGCMAWASFYIQKIHLDDCLLSKLYLTQKVDILTKVSEALTELHMTNPKETSSCNPVIVVVLLYFGAIVRFVEMKIN